MIEARKDTSAVSVSLLRRFSSRPAGVVSKNDIGSRNTCVSGAPCSVLCLSLPELCAGWCMTCRPLYLLSQGFKEIGGIMVSGRTYS